MLYTGATRVDTVKLGPKNVRNGKIEYPTCKPGIEIKQTHQIGHTAKDNTNRPSPVLYYGLQRVHDRPHFVQIPVGVEILRFIEM